MFLYEQIKDKAVALLVWNTQVENDVRVCLGKIEPEANGYCFKNDRENWRCSLSQEQWSRLREVDQAVKSILLGADYCIQLTISDLPEGSTGECFTGMKWQP